MIAELPPRRCGSGARVPAAGDATWRPPRLDDASICAEARSWVRQVLPPLEPRCDPGLVEVAELVVSELITNAMRHAGGMRGAQLVRDGDVVRLTVQDDDPRPPVVVAAGTDQERIGGWGMQLVDALADDWGVCICPARGKCVWADLRPGTPKSP